MNDDILRLLIEIFGVGGVLMLAIRYLFKKLAEQYECRIDALEAASARCEADRIELRNQQTKLLIDLLELKKNLSIG